MQQMAIGKKTMKKNIHLQNVLINLIFGFKCCSNNYICNVPILLSLSHDQIYKCIKIEIACIYGVCFNYWNHLHVILHNNNNDDGK